LNLIGVQICVFPIWFRSSNDSQSLVLDQREDGRTGERRPGPVVAPPQVVAPGARGIGSAALPEPPAPGPVPGQAKPATVPGRATAMSKASAAPGFSF